MSVLLSSIAIVAGLVLLIMGAEALIRGASSVAKKMSIPEIVIGLTIVALGTSAPELVVNAIAAVSGKYKIVFGNIIGSNMANILLVLGVAGLIYPLTVQRSTVWKEIPFLLLATGVLFLLVYDSWSNEESVNLLSRNDGLVLLGLFAIFITYTFGLSKVESTDEFDVTTYSHWVSVLMIFGGMAGLSLGGLFAVKGAESIAEQLCISEKFISSVILAVGTSLPELATSAVAAYRKRCDIAVGNIVGSCIFNLLMVLGICGVIRPVSYSSTFNVDAVLLIGATVLLFVTMFTGKGRRLDRWEAGLMLVGYAGYIGYLTYTR